MQETKIEFQLYYEKIKEKIKYWASQQVPITSYDRVKYHDLFEKYPTVFNYNATKDFYMAMKSYIRKGKRWCINCAGRTRHGKSEVAQTWTMAYIDEYNQALIDGCFKHNEEIGIKYKMQILEKLKAEDVLLSQSNRLYHLRNLERQDSLIYGKPTIVDEDKPSTGGLGSYTEKVEIENSENITAQAMQPEWQLRPDRFVLINAPYGLFQEKMDFEHQVNWSMLYEQRTDPTRKNPFIFKGWVATPLHEDNELRIKYNEAKKENIKAVMEGRGDLRLVERQKIALILSKDETFATRTVNGKTFKYSKDQQECILNEWIVSGKCQSFNMMEKIEIVDYARLLAEKEYQLKNGAQK